MIPQNSEKRLVSIKLADHGQAAVFSGRDRGEIVRNNYSALDGSCSDIKILLVVPAHVFTVSSSFFLGLFGPIIKLLGEAKFRLSLKIEGPYSTKFLDSAIDQAASLMVPL